MKSYQGNIEKLTVDNRNFRQVLYTGEHSQLVLMSLRPGEDIGQEVHSVDQFFRFEKGQGRVVIDGISHEVGDGDAVIVPASAQHNVINLSVTEPLQLYTIYSPPNHRDGVTHISKDDATRNEEYFDGQTTEK